MAKGRASATEKERRAEKEFQRLMNDAFMRWSEPDEEGNFLIDNLPVQDKARLLAGRMPKPVQVDQDFEASMIGLGAMLEALPEPVDKATDLQALRGRCRKLEFEIKQLRRCNAAMRKRLKGSDSDWHELVERAYEAGQLMRNQNKTVAEALDIPLREFDQLVSAARYK